MAESRQYLIDRLKQKVNELAEQKCELENRCGQIHQVINRCGKPQEWGNRSWEVAPESFQGNDDDYRRLVLNNERFGLVASHFEEQGGAYFTRDALKHGFSFHDGHSDDVIRRFAEHGDPLCLLLKEGLDHYGYDPINNNHRKDFWEGVDRYKIATQLVSRKGMTAEDYEKYVKTLTERIKLPQNKPKSMLTVGLG